MNHHHGDQHLHNDLPTRQSEARLKVIILTSLRTGMAVRCLPVLAASPLIQIQAVILAGSKPISRWKSFLRKWKKVRSIGLLGAFNGLRMRKWYHEETADIEAECLRLGLPFNTTPSINCDTTRALFRDAEADLGLSLGNTYIGKSVFSIPRLGMINVHEEILPDYQNAQSILWPIYEGRSETGLTIHQVDQRIDTGPILHQVRYPIAFRASLGDTVRASLQVCRQLVPEAVRYVCEHYDELRTKAKPQTGGRVFTTPSYWQYRRMVKNHAALYAASLQAANAGST